MPNAGCERDPPRAGQRNAREIEYAQEIDDFLHDKFRNHALYLFLQRRTGELYRRALQARASLAPARPSTPSTSSVA